MTNNSKTVAEALRAYAECAEEGLYAIDYHTLTRDAGDPHALARALQDAGGGLLMRDQPSFTIYQTP